MKRITIIASGTRGDVQPAIAFGNALQADGYAVRLLASRGYAEWIERHGLEAAPSQIDMDVVMASDDGQAWIRHGHNPIQQLRLMQRLFDSFGPRLIREAWEASQDAAAVISSFTSDTYALAIGERLDVPVVSMPLQPTLLATRDGRAMTNALLPDRISRINAWFGRAVLEPFPWRLYGRHVNDFRREIGLAPQTSAQNSAARRRMTMLHAISRHVMPHPADWPLDFRITGYWFLVDERDRQPDARLRQFLAAGPPPVYLGFGSMTLADRTETTRLLVDAIGRSGQRAVLSMRGVGIETMGLPTQILAIADAPHAWLFPRVSAIVHHGGAGTTAAGLAAGVPSVVIPHIADQPYWGRRVRALGVGPKPIPRHRLTASGLSDAIQQAVSDKTMRQRAAALAARIRTEDGLGAAVMAMEHAVGPPGVDAAAAR